MLRGREYFSTEVINFLFTRGLQTVPRSQIHEITRFMRFFPDRVDYIQHTIGRSVDI